MGFRISVDTGGTFTDVVVADETGVLHLAKAPTDLERAFQSIEDGLCRQGEVRPRISIRNGIDVEVVDARPAAADCSHSTADELEHGLALIHADCSLASGSVAWGEQRFPP